MARGNIDSDQIQDAAKHGSRSKIQMSDGTGAAGNLAIFNSDGSLTDGGTPGGGGGTGTVTSVGLTVPSRQTVTGSPVTASGTLAIADNNQSANQVFAGPSSGSAAAPAFRALVSADIPVIPFSTLTDGSSVTWATGGAAESRATITLNHATATRSLALAGLVNGARGTLVIMQDSTGGAAMTLGGSGYTNVVVNNGAGAITLTSSANALDVWNWFYDGTNVYWTEAQNFTAAAGLPSGMKLWFQADAISGVSDGTTISSWPDSSGNANNCSVTSGSATYHTAQINGKAAVTFSSCHMSLATAIANSNGHSAFAVIKLASTAAKSTLFSGPINSFAYWFAATSGKLQGADKTQVSSLGSGTASADTNWHQTNMLFTNNSGGFSLLFRLDRANDATIAGAAADATANQTSLGYNAQNGGENFNGQLAEFIYYDRTLTTTERAQIETYLNGKYGL